MPSLKIYSHRGNAPRQKGHTSLLRVTISLLLLCSLILSVCSCSPFSNSKRVVGRVDSYDISYDELYYLAHNYADSLSPKYKDDTQGLSTAVKDSVFENIVSNYAVLTLCEREGLEYDEEKLSERVSNTVKNRINATYQGDKAAFKADLAEHGMSEHYLRFIIGVDLMYGDLVKKYKEDGVLPSTNEELAEYVKAKFVHTWHVAVFVDSGDDRDAEYQKALYMLDEINSGASMYNLIGGQYNEDLITDNLKDTYGHYFPRGIMEPWYEEAAFSLKVNQHSGIIEAVGKNNNGEYVPCFYIIERLPIADNEISANLTTLSDLATEAIMLERLEQLKDELSFSPNEYASSLDFAALPALKEANVTLAISIAVALIAVVALALAVVLLRKRKTKKFRHELSKSSTKVSLATEDGKPYDGKKDRPSKDNEKKK